MALYGNQQKLQSASKKRKILHLEHCTLQAILNNLHQFLLTVGLRQRATWSKWTSVTANAWVGFLSVVGESKLLCFGDPSLELHRSTVLVMIRASDSSRLNRGEEFWFLCGFPFWWKWQWYRIQILIRIVSMRCHNIL